MGVRGILYIKTDYNLKLPQASGKLAQEKLRKSMQRNCTQNINSIENQIIAFNKGRKLDLVSSLTPAE